MRSIGSYRFAPRRVAAAAAITTTLATLSVAAAPSAAADPAGPIPQPVVQAIDTVEGLAYQTLLRIEGLPPYVADLEPLYRTVNSTVDTVDRQLNYLTYGDPLKNVNWSPYCQARRAVFAAINANDDGYPGYPDCGSRGGYAHAPT